MKKAPPRGFLVLSAQTGAFYPLRGLGLFVPVVGTAGKDLQLPFPYPVDQPVGGVDPAAPEATQLAF